LGQWSPSFWLNITTGGGGDGFQLILHLERSYEDRETVRKRDVPLNLFLLMSVSACIHEPTLYIYIYIISSISPFVPFAFQDLQPCHSRFWPTRKMIFIPKSHDLNTRQDKTRLHI
jgi:hypothetical protein